jgi:hypothetical protein
MEAAVSWTFSAVRLGCSPHVGMMAIVLNLLARDRQTTSSFTPRKLVGQIAPLLGVLWLNSSSDEPFSLGFAQSLTAHNGEGEKSVESAEIPPWNDTRESRDPKVACDAGLRIAWQNRILR